jgi:hypothetical protein
MSRYGRSGATKLRRRVVGTLGRFFSFKYQYVAVPSSESPPTSNFIDRTLVVKALGGAHSEYSANRGQS